MLIRCLMLLVVAASVQAKPQLTWLQTDWPPHQIVSGPFQGQGTFDLVQQHLMAGMPQFVHQSRLISLPRLEQAFVQQEAAICVLGTLYSDERAQNRLFSVPMAVGPALAVGVEIAIPVAGVTPGDFAQRIEIAGKSLEAFMVQDHEKDRL